MGAECYERTADRPSHYERGSPPRPAKRGADTQVQRAALRHCDYQRRRRREVSVEEAMMAIRLSGVLARNIGDVSESPWGSSTLGATTPTSTRRLPRPRRRRRRRARGDQDQRTTKIDRDEHVETLIGTGPREY